jgi:hypothetical protein
LVKSRKRADTNPSGQGDPSLHIGAGAQDDGFGIATHEYSQLLDQIPALLRAVVVNDDAAVRQIVDLQFARDRFLGRARPRNLRGERLWGRITLHRPM